MNKPAFSVTQLINSFNLVLKDKFSSVSLEAEISSLKFHSNGHVYLDLKDASCSLNAVIWRSTLSRIKVKPAIGQKVICRVVPNIFPARGSLQVQINSMSLVGAGDLQQQFAELKEKLSAEGIFSPERKRSLPLLPKQIGIITSESGAVIGDMKAKFAERFPAVELFLYSAIVQGQSAPESMIAGFNYFNQQRPELDLIILARGGGSIEDLWCFNDEKLVRTVFGSGIPVLTGIGHEPDISLCDLAADRYATTPTAAAAIAVPDRRELVNSLKHFRRLFAEPAQLLNTYIQIRDTLAESLEQSGSRLLDLLRLKINTQREKIRLLRPTRQLALKQEQITFLRQRLIRAVQITVKNRQALEQIKQRFARGQQQLLVTQKQQLKNYHQRYAALNPKQILARGYSLVYQGERLVTDPASLNLNDIVNLEFDSGRRKAEIKE